MKQAMSVKKLVFGVKVGGTDDQNLHLADGPVSDSWWDQDAGFRVNRVPHAVKLDRGVGLAFQDDVDLRVTAVVVGLGVSRDFGQVHRTGKLLAIGESTTGVSAGARDGRQFGEPDDFGGGRGNGHGGSV